MNFMGMNKRALETSLRNRVSERSHFIPYPNLIKI
jgi:hypothetical protein